MIKFFRRIRQNLLMENPPAGRAGKTGSPAEASAKVGKYISYAIGEIILVVVGILIALSINNRNEERVAKDRAYSFLKQINEDLSIEIKSYEADIEALSSHSLIFDEAGKNNTLEDSLLVKLGRIINQNYRPNDFGSSYHGFVISGEIDLIEDKRLLKELQVYYTYGVGNLNNLAEYHATFILHNIEGRLLDRLEMQPDGSFTLESIKKELESGSLKSMVNWQNLTYKALIKRVKECKDLAQTMQQKIDEMEKTKG